MDGGDFAIDRRVLFLDRDPDPSISSYIEYRRCHFDDSSAGHRIGLHRQKFSGLGTSQACRLVRFEAMDALRQKPPQAVNGRAIALPRLNRQITLESCDATGCKR